MNIKIIRAVAALTMALGLTTVAHALGAGLYVGIQGGMSNTHNVPAYLEDGDGDFVLVKPSSTGFGISGYVGYNYNPYFGLEIGATHYANATFKLPVGNASTSIPQIHEYAVDIVGKGMFPIGDFGVFAKGGVSLIRVTSSGSLVDTGVYSSSSTAGRPILAVGISYDLTQNWVADLTASRVFGSGMIQNADLIAVGVSYHFVDRYCGQFLC